MAVALAVVEDRLALQRVLGLGEVDRAGARRARGLDGPLERVERGPGVAAGALGEQSSASSSTAGGSAMPRSGSASARLEQALDVAGLERVQLVDLAAREQRRVDLEVGVLGRRADQRHEPLLDRGQQRVLLGLVEAVDLVEEEDRRLRRASPALRGAGDHLADLGAGRR